MLSARPGFLTAHDWSILTAHSWSMLSIKQLPKFLEVCQTVFAIQNGGKSDRKKSNLFLHSTSPLALALMMLLQKQTVPLWVYQRTHLGRTECHSPSPRMARNSYLWFLQMFCKCCSWCTLGTCAVSFTKVSFGEGECMLRQGKRTLRCLQKAETVKSRSKDYLEDFGEYCKTPLKFCFAFYFLFHLSN